MNLSNIDAKQSIIIPVNSHNTCTKASRHEMLDYEIWIIDNFISENQCNNIINACCNKGFEHLEYRNSERLIFENKELTQLIEERLANDMFIERLNLNKVKPYGFDNGVTWSKNTSDINPCLRVNKYNVGQGFDVHRDAQYTESIIKKSNYTLLIYLNDNNGNTEFFIPINEYKNNGYTVEEELEKFKFATFPVIPVTGRAVIFDQRLLHKGNITDKTKYVMRTDLLCCGVQSSVVEKSRIQDLCKSLFRQAQYQELLEKQQIIHKGFNTTKLYEICIGLRQTPNTISYPNHLNKHLKNLSINTDITSTLHLASRNGLQYCYTFNKQTDDLTNIIKFAYAYAVLSSVKNIYKNEIYDDVGKLCKNFNIEITTNDNLTQNKNFFNQCLNNNKLSLHANCFEYAAFFIRKEKNTIVK